MMKFALIHARPIAIIDLELWDVVRRRSNGPKRFASPMDRTRVSMPVVRTQHHVPIHWDKYTPDKYLLVHCSIVSSCCVEKDGHTITPNSSRFVNENGNAWQNQVMQETYRTFIGAANYREHVQIPALRKGDIVDAVLREVDNDGEMVYYCDILSATERKHADLVYDIETQRLNSMSMGTLALRTQCSRCGIVVSDSKDNCEHVDRQLLHPYVDDNGVKRITAELCGIRTGKDKNKSNIFVEASWVYHPAFKGAVINHFVTPINRRRVASVQHKVDMRNRFAAYLDTVDVRMRVASRIAHVSTVACMDERRVLDIANRIL